MNLRALLTFFIINFSIILVYSCTKDKLSEALPGDLVIYGIRQDGAIAILPSDIIAKGDELQQRLDYDKGDAFFTNCQIFIILVADQLQLLYSLRHTDKDIFGVTKLYYVREFRRLLVPTINRTAFLPEVQKHSRHLLSVADSQFNPYTFYMERGTHLYGFRAGFNQRTLIDLKRIGTRVYVSGLKNLKVADTYKNLNPFPLINAERYNTWVVLDLKEDEGKQRKCFAKSNYRYTIEIMYKGRAKHLQMFSEMSTEKQKYSSENETTVTLEKGAIFIGARNGYLFVYKLQQDTMRLSEMLNELDYMQIPYQDGMLKKDEKIYLFSINGFETIVVIIGKKSWYKVFSTRLFVGSQHIIYKLDRKMMVEIDGLEEKPMGVRYDHEKQIVYVHYPKSKLFKFEVKENQAVKLETAKYENFRLIDPIIGEVVGYENEPHLAPWQLMNKRYLGLKEDKIILQLSNETRSKQVDHRSIVTVYGNAVDYLLYLPSEHFTTQMLSTMRFENRYSFFGIIGCTYFIFQNIQTMKNIKWNAKNCEVKNNVRAFLEDSFLYVVEEKDKSTVNVYKIKISFTTNELQTIKHGDYIHSDRKGSVSIMPGTFKAVYVKNHEIYYLNPQNQQICVMPFSKRRFTAEILEPVNQTIPLTVFAKWYSAKCNTTVYSTLYDPSLRTVFYQLKDGEKISLESSNLAAIKKLINWEKLGQDIDNEPMMLTNHMLTYRTISKKEWHYADLAQGDRIFDVPKESKKDLRFFGLYDGYFLIRTPRIKPILKQTVMEDDIWVQEAVKEEPTTPGTDLREMEPASTAQEGPLLVVEETLFGPSKCILVQSPFFIPFMVKIIFVDILLTLLMVSLIFWHRMKIVPARRRSKIAKGVMKKRKKRAFQARARRRLRRLNILRRRREREKKKKKQSSSSSTSEEFKTVVSEKGKK